MSYCSVASRWFIVLLLVGLTAVRTTAQQSLTGIDPPADQIKLFTLSAVGEQIYISQEKAGDPTHFEWVLLEPRAVLYDAYGQRIGRHAKGPIWEIPGGKVTGLKLQAQPAPQPNAIPWLLLEVIQYQGSKDGPLSTAAFIQRIDTAGGVAPTYAPERAGLKRSVPYTANYVFWGRSSMTR